MKEAPLLHCNGASLTEWAAPLLRNGSLNGLMPATVFRFTNSLLADGGCNNAIKALKRVAFGFRNFSNFRARILQAANPAHPNF